MPSAQILEALRKLFLSELVLVKGTAQYDQSNESYLSARESEISPSIIVRPRSKEDVASFVRIIKSSEYHDIKFAVRGAGQQPLPGCANIDGGITLDLSLLTGIVPDADSGIVTIAAGERWGAIYEELDGTGLGIGGARSAKGGIGGLSLAGGLSFFSSREGFICDNVVNYEIVLASAEIVNANAYSNTDLFHALRGGGNNFGIVTRYDIRTFEQGCFWGGSIYYFPASFPSQIEALVAELQKPDATDETHLMMSIGYAAQFGQTMCMNQMYYTREVENPEVLKAFTEVQPQIQQMNSMRMMTLKEAATEQASDAQDRQRCAYMNTTVKADTAILLKASEIYTAALDDIKPCEGLMCSLTLQPYPMSLLKRSAAYGGNSLGLDTDNGPLVSILLLTYWKRKEDDERVLSITRGVLEHIDREAQKSKTGVRFKYLNYAAEFQNPIESYGDENMKRLREVSRKYDPAGLFQDSVPGGCKLFS